MWSVSACSLAVHAMLTNMFCSSTGRTRMNSKMNTQLCAKWKIPYQLLSWLPSAWDKKVSASSISPSVIPTVFIRDRPIDVKFSWRPSEKWKNIDWISLKYREQTYPTNRWHRARKFASIWIHIKPTYWRNQHWLEHIRSDQLLVLIADKHKMKVFEAGLWNKRWSSSWSPRGWELKREGSQFSYNKGRQLRCCEGGRGGGGITWLASSSSLW